MVRQVKWLIKDQLQSNQFCCLQAALLTSRVTDKFSKTFNIGELGM